MATKPMFAANLLPLEAKETMYAEISEWFQLTEQIAPLVEREKELRQTIFNKWFAPNPELKEGTNHINLEFGKMLTADYRINRKVDEAQLDAALATGHITREMADSLLNYKPSLRIGDWKEAPPETRVLWGEIVTETPGMVGLKITTPKK